MTIKLLLKMMIVRGWNLKILDIGMGFIHSPIRQYHIVYSKLIVPLLMKKIIIEEELQCLCLSHSIKDFQPPLHGSLECQMPVAWVLEN